MRGRGIFLDGGNGHFLSQPVQFVPVKEAFFFEGQILGEDDVEPARESLVIEALYSLLQVPGVVFARGAPPEPVSLESHVLVGRVNVSLFKIDHHAVEDCCHGGCFIGGRVCRQVGFAAGRGSAEHS